MVFFMSKKYEQLIPRASREALEKCLGMESGYVLDFSDRTFADFFYETVNIDVQVSNLFDGRGTSKAKRLRAFIENSRPGLVAKVLRELWEYRVAGKDGSKEQDEDQLRERYFAVVALFEGEDTSIDTSAFEAFEPNETLEELVAAIRRDLDAKRPQAAMDRLHTYCMKRFASLIRKHGGEESGKNDPLHSRVGKYVKLLRKQRTFTPMSDRIIRSSINVFEALNPIRNDQSFAHDNPDLIEMEEARFIFDSVTAILRYVKAIDTRLFED